MPARSTATTPSPTFIPKREVLARYGNMSPSWLARRLRSGTFPRPVYIGGGKTPFWKITDLEAYEADPANHPPSVP